MEARWCCCLRGSMQQHPLLAARLCATISLKPVSDGHTTTVTTPSSIHVQWEVTPALRWCAAALLRDSGRFRAPCCLVPDAWQCRLVSASIKCRHRFRMCVSACLRCLLKKSDSIAACMQVRLQGCEFKNNTPKHTLVLSPGYGHEEFYSDKRMRVFISDFPHTSHTRKLADAPERSWERRMRCEDGWCECGSMAWFIVRG